MESGFQSGNVVSAKKEGNIRKLKAGSSGQYGAVGNLETARTVRTDVI